LNKNYKEGIQFFDLAEEYPRDGYKELDDYSRKSHDLDR
jgi:hypothetical protein